MLITDRFVYVHQPKTGGTFVTGVLKEIHRGRQAKHRVGAQGSEASERPYGTLQITQKHGNCRDIPAKHRGKPMVSAIRSPYARYVSDYRFGHWKSAYFLPYYAVFLAEHHLESRFPDLTFPEFVHLINAAFCDPEQRDLPFDDSVGFLTNRFVDFYFREPFYLKPSDVDRLIETEGWRDLMFEVQFLRTETLNHDLHRFLLDMDYDPQDVGFILGTGRIVPVMRNPDRHRVETIRLPPNVSSTALVSSDMTWQEYYTPELKAMVRARERLLFAIFPEYNDGA